MCGIAGVYAPGRRLELDSVTRMTDAIAHRGPDDSGVQLLAGGALILGHRRLSIVDLSPLGHQPMATADRKLWIVYNGEVYNSREIRAELAALGWSFRSDCDTEVILAAYGQWCLAAVERFRGMFAFALWDEGDRRLHLCRDRFGVKPLYYALRNGVLAFGSELRALNIAGFTSRNVDPAGVAEFLRYGYISAPRSIFEDVSVIRPGTICSFDADLRVTERVYWNTQDLYEGPDAERLRRELAALPQDALLDRVEEELGRAFEYRMVADVPVGLFLSGGIDSSLVAALLARRAGLRLKTFTIGYGDSEYDERQYARQVAGSLGADHVELLVSPQVALDVAMQLPELADEPIGDSSFVPTYLVSKLARERVKVALSADGADELFGGYARYAYCGSFLERRSRLLKGLYQLSAELLDRLPPALIHHGYALARRGGPKFAGIGDKLRKFIRMARARNAFEAYDATGSERSAAEAARLMAQPPSELPGRDAAFHSVHGADVRDRLMHWDLSHYLPGDLLVKVDRASMAVSLEAREPFLDHIAARTAAALPMAWKVRGATNKYVLRRLLDRHFPAGLFDRPKQGFTAPVAEWLRGPLREVFLYELSPQRVRRAGILDEAAAQTMARDFLDRNAGQTSAAAWFTFQLQQWAGRWLDPPVSEQLRAKTA